MIWINAGNWRGGTVCQADWLDQSEIIYSDVVLIIRIFITFHHQSSPLKSLLIIDYPLFVAVIVFTQARTTENNWKLGFRGQLVERETRFWWRHKRTMFLLVHCQWLYIRTSQHHKHFGGVLIEQSPKTKANPCHWHECRDQRSLHRTDWATESCAFVLILNHVTHHHL